MYLLRQTWRNNELIFVRKLDGKRFIEATQKLTPIVNMTGQYLDWN